MKHKKTILLIAAGVLVVPLSALAQGLVSVTPFIGTAGGTIGLLGAITNIINALLGLAGLLAAIFVVIGGVRYIFAQGDEDAQIQARNTILYAVIGIIVIIISGVLINFVLSGVLTTSA